MVAEKTAKNFRGYFFSAAPCRLHPVVMSFRTLDRAPRYHCFRCTIFRARSSRNADRANCYQVFASFRTTLVSSWTGLWLAIAVVTLVGRSL